MLAIESMMNVSLARAILGISDGASPSMLRRGFIAQVRRWHPDRFANDPTGRAVAEDKLRDAICAYQFLLKDRAESCLHQKQPPPCSQNLVPGRLPRSEIDSIVQAISPLSPLHTALAFFGWSWPLWIAASIVLQTPTATIGRGRLVPALLLIALAGLLKYGRSRAAKLPPRVPPLNVEERPVDYQTLLSACLGLIWLLFAASYGGALALLQAALSVAMPLFCIWFPEEMAFGTLASVSSPPCLVRAFGWLAFLALTFGGAVLATVNY